MTECGLSGPQFWKVMWDKALVTRNLHGSAGETLPVVLETNPCFGKHWVGTSIGASLWVVRHNVLECVVP